MSVENETEITMEKVVEQMPAAVMVLAQETDADPRIVCVNGQMKKVLGVTAQTCRELDFFFSFIEQEDYETVRKAVMEVFRSHISLDKIYKIHDAENRIRWIHMLLNSRGQENGWLYFGIFTDVTAMVQEERERDERQKRRLEHYNKLLTSMDQDFEKDLVMKVHIDGTENRVVRWWSGEDGYQIDESYTLWSFRDYILEHAFSDADRQLLWKHVDYDTIVKEIEMQGYSKASVEYLRVTPAGTTAWTRYELRSVEDPLNHHIHNYMYLYNVYKELLPPTFSNQMVMQDCDMVGLINLANGVVQTYLFSGKEAGKMKVTTQEDYRKSCEDFAQQCIDPEMQNEFLWNMDICTVREKLEVTEGVYHIGYWTGMNGVRRRKSWRFSYVNEQHSSILIARSDITESYMDTAVYNEKIREFKQELEVLNKDITGVLTRRAVRREVRSLFAKRKNGIFTIVMVDIDNLKYINDKFGHPAGDFAIESIANILLQNFRSTDLVGRIGGDEFLVLCDGGDISFIRKKLDTIVEMVNTVIVNKKENYHLSCSIGFFGTSYGKESFEEVYRKVDTALYKAKTGGKNRTSEYTDEL